MIFKEAIGCISQFTLAAETQKGLRPGFLAADPEHAKNLYDYFLECAKALTQENTFYLASGVFAADMQVALTNDGPVTFLLES